MGLPRPSAFELNLPRLTITSVIVIMLSLLALLLLQFLVGAQAEPLTLTAITTINGRSVLQCWRLQDDSTTSSNAGTSGLPVSPLGRLTEPLCLPVTASPASRVILPPGKRAPIHAAPAVQYVV